ncbi:MAG: hypothetical protein KJ069_18385 [Anaerolineae bacterium]|nr:hypothetical protein [Anaerolineae bacterium]
MNSMEYSPSVDRPGCVTAYAVLAWFGAAAYICGALALAVSGLSDPEFTVFGLILALVIGVLSLLPILTGIGLWKMTMWGWWLVVLINGLGVAGSLLNMLVAVLLVSQEPNAIGTLCGGVIGLAIYGYILYWFITNRSLFGNYTTQTVMGLDGEIIKERVKTRGFDTASAIAIVGVVAVMCLIPIFTIIVLTLLGPQIGNVFSRITAGLEATPLPR